MSREALRRIQNLRDDDIFLSFDADEIPKPEVKRIKDSSAIDGIGHYSCNTLKINFSSKC